jgi:hypothetical protein
MLTERVEKFGFSADTYGWVAIFRPPDDRVSEIWEGPLDVHGTVIQAVIHSYDRPATA